MQARDIPNRWGIAVAGIIMQLALGGVYAWSVFVKPLRDFHNNTWSVTEVSLTFTIAIFMIGIGSTVGGFWMDRAGPRRVATVAGVLYGLGVIVASLGTSLPVLYLGYGLLGGLGNGLGYIVPVATLVKWFPDRRGLITGLAVAGFGAGALITGPVATLLIRSSGVYRTFLLLGITYLILVVIVAQFFKNPPAGYAPAGWQPTRSETAARTRVDFTLKQALRTPQWYMLWAILFLNVSAGIMLISQASPMAQNITHVDAIVAAGLVGLISIFNGVGRIFWAWLSDFIGRRQVYLTMYILQAVIFFVMTQARSFVFFSILAVIVALCYGGGFGTMPAFAADYFGPKYVGFVYGTMLTAWGFGGVLGPILIAQVYDRTHTYTTALVIIAIIMVVATILPLMVRPPTPLREMDSPSRVA